jgi:cytochrome c oxidase subunit 1
VSFVALFIIGGLSGIFMAATPVDIPIHDTYFIVAHIHYVLFGGSLFAIFAGITYWYPKMFGRLMSERWGMIHFVGTFITYNLAFFPMHGIGLQGMMRRLYDPTQYAYLQPLQPWNEFISIAVFVLFAFQLIFAVNFLMSIRTGKVAGPNPWRATTLEWSAPSPPPHGNFQSMPVVYRGPYEYSVPGAKEDFILQTDPPDGVAVPHPAPTSH